MRLKDGLTTQVSLTSHADVVFFLSRSSLILPRSSCISCLSLSSIPSLSLSLSLFLSVSLASSLSLLHPLSVFLCARLSGFLVTAISLSPSLSLSLLLALCPCPKYLQHHHVKRVSLHYLLQFMAASPFDICSATRLLFKSSL